MSNKPWSPENAVSAFTAALTRSAYDGDFRGRLLNFKSPEEVKRAVSEEGGIDIPDEVMIVFHEKKDNANYHVFHLPAFHPEGPHQTHTYEVHFKCCYKPWRRRRQEEGQAT